MIRPLIDPPSLPLPCFENRVPCGFPSPAQDHAITPIDLNTLCVRHPAATYFVRACGESMTGAGIHDGDLLVVDRALTPRHGDVVIACLHGEFTVKRLQCTPYPALLPANPDYPVLPLGDGEPLELMGVVTFALHTLERGTS
ncbi:translesion error-prone DNA polymerase V autoproteolytic subunit [Aeromonas schubertii]|uniref:Translesion error-prone DNA polymerase V autoproteolytic subunit n=1 Tax=Aeromonas schubertii TaxID=652 RepID=A0A0S2SPC6_9GAMM|nr:translesion error-prone DNA polymerase V autoproteolytic subunit [Aeromonas schubertii]ALP43390.1 umuD protein [Aeromonas schubertii]MBZ6065759.1 translesion error-prone DNA polymerase V autoproteolytic subunit [Aeromonas schubertii]MBZ6072076.1 translesion error-prone DNA polymerase V autoproteolytic subunit [Aeromonas schubertii]QCG48245.1 translesion error-prone DNA polymerase V autoproteolytic subunit [Aeromonas schubertii]